MKIDHRAELLVPNDCPTLLGADFANCLPVQLIDGSEQLGGTLDESSEHVPRERDTAVGEVASNMRPNGERSANLL